MDQIVQEQIFRSNTIISKLTKSMSELQLAIVRQQDIQNILLIASVGSEDSTAIDREFDKCQSVINDIQEQIQRTQVAIEQQQALIKTLSDIDTSSEVETTSETDTSPEEDTPDGIGNVLPQGGL